MIDAARLLISCADRPGIVAAVSGFLAGRGANIVTLDQYSSDPIGGRFFMRVSFVADELAPADAPEVPIADPDVPALAPELAVAASSARVAASPPGAADAVATFRAAFEQQVASEFAMQWRIRLPGSRPKTTLMVSREDHCLLDLLWRWRRGELAMDVTQVISNHEGLRGEVEQLGLPYHHVPVERGHKPEAEAKVLELLGPDVELVLLARYMQILSGDFLARVGCPVINIHHSFLPAFAGAQPYERARERGVKLIGATAHYVTEELDAGPIIEQDVLRVDHSATAADLERIGRDVERVAFARAVHSHLDDRVLVDGRRTIIF